jgi:hypothetical protein
MVTHEECEKVNERAAELKARVPRAVSARYDRHNRRVVVRLSSNCGIFFSPLDAALFDGPNPPTKILASIARFATATLAAHASATYAGNQ